MNCRIVFIGCLLLIMQAGCGPETHWSPTGYKDDGTQVALKVSDTWQAALFAPTQAAVKKRLKDDAATAEFTTFPQFSAFYDRRQDITRLQVYGIVQTTDDRGVHKPHRYTAGWQRNGKVDADDNAPWDAAGVTLVDGN